MGETVALNSLNLEPIGLFHSTFINKYDCGQQASQESSAGHIEIDKHLPYNDMLKGLETFSHIWLVFLFNNKHWKAKVQTPRLIPKKGVLATRSPYRPNPIGLSCVEIERVFQNKVYVKNHDLLDQTSILDIKPYLSYSDSFPTAKLGWVEDIEEYSIEFSEFFELQLENSTEINSDALKKFIVQQLANTPKGHPHKRIKTIDTNKFQIAYKTLKVEYSIFDRNVCVLAVN